MSKLPKELTEKINQKIVSRLYLKQSALKSYSIYKLNGFSEVGKPYVFRLSFVSLYPIKIENIVDTDAKIDNKIEPRREYTTQYNQSDLEFITMPCEEEGYSLIYHYEDDFDNPFNITL